MGPVLAIGGSIIGPRRSEVQPRALKVWLQIRERRPGNDRAQHGSVGHAYTVRAFFRGEETEIVRGAAGPAACVKCVSPAHRRYDGTTRGSGRRRPAPARGRGERDRLKWRSCRTPDRRASSGTPAHRLRDAIAPVVHFVASQRRRAVCADDLVEVHRFVRMIAGNIESEDVHQADE